MRLAIIRQHYTPTGGGDRHFEGALEALLERNVAISLYTRAWPQTKLQLIEPVICDPWFAGSMLREWTFARAVTRAIGRSKANLVESHERLVCCDIYRARDGVHAVWVEERRKGASVADRLRLAISPYNRYMLSVERRLFASPWLQAVICNSKMVRDEIRDRFGLPESKLPVVYNAVDTDAFHPNLRAERGAVLRHLAIDESAVVFLLAASGYEHTGAGTAIEALAELPAPAHLIIAGRSRHIERYRELAISLGVAERVTMVGAEIDPRACYAAADAFVLPSLYDPAPESTLEAMACGLPVITSTKSGAAELLVPYGGGLVCPAGDVPGLAAQMRALLDPATRDRLGASARRAVEPLTPSAITLQLVLLYRDLLAASVQAKPGTRSREGREAVGADVAPSTPLGRKEPPESPAAVASDGAPNAKPPEAMSEGGEAPPILESAAATPETELPAEGAAPGLPKL